MSRLPPEYFAGRHKVLVVADAVFDDLIYPQTTEDFEEFRKLYQSGASLEEVIELAHDQKRTYVKRNVPAGPCLNTAAYLAAHSNETGSPIKCVSTLFSADGVESGVDADLTEESAEYLEHLERLGIEFRIETREGDMPHCGYVVEPYVEDIHNGKDWIEKAIMKLSEKVYITIDLDVFDPSIMPSVGTPEPGD